MRLTQLLVWVAQEGKILSALKTSESPKAVTASAIHILAFTRMTRFTPY